MATVITCHFKLGLVPFADTTRRSSTTGADALIQKPAMPVEGSTSDAKSTVVVNMSVLYTGNG